MATHVSLSLPTATYFAQRAIFIGGVDISSHRRNMIVMSTAEPRGTLDAHPDKPLLYSSPLILE